MLGQFQKRSLGLRPLGRVLAQREMDCLDTARIAAFAQEPAVLAANFPQDVEDPVVHLTYEKGVA